LSTECAPFHREIRQRKFTDELAHLLHFALLLAAFATRCLALHRRQRAFDERLLPPVHRRRGHLVVAADFRHGSPAFKDGQDDFDALLGRETGVATLED
jgi:hypothetical protein